MLCSAQENSDSMQLMPETQVLLQENSLAKAEISVRKSEIAHELHIKCQDLSPRFPVWSNRPQEA